MALINCPICGKQVSDRGTDCIHCGSSLIVKFAECPECGSRQAEENERCEICGCPLNVKYISCPECGNEMPEDAIRCETCGCPIEECVPIQVTEATPQAPWQPEMTYMPAEATAGDATVIDKQAVRKKIKKYRILSDICLCLAGITMGGIIWSFVNLYGMAPGFHLIFRLLF